MISRISPIIFTFLVLLLFAGGCGEEESPAAPGVVNTSPSINSILPPGASPGISVTITGSNFGNDQGNGTVQVGDNDAAIDSWSNTEITFTIPAGLSGGFIISVDVNTDAGRRTSVQFEITPPNTYKVTSDHAMDNYPCWGPNGEWIYFSSTRDDHNWNIWRIPSIGGIAEQLTSGPMRDFFPTVRFSSGELAWSSINTFSGQNPEGDAEIFRGFPLCPDPGTVCTITMATSNESRDIYPAWARTVYAGYSMVYTWEEVDQDGHYLAWRIMLMSGTGPVELVEGEQPSFSPDGRWVVYSHDSNLYKIPTDGGAPVQLTDEDSDTRPHWGCGDKIVFERFNSGNGQDIFIMNSDGTDVHALVSTQNDEYWPRWSADCSRVVYYSLVSGEFDIYVYVVP